MKKDKNPFHTNVKMQHTVPRFLLDNFGFKIKPKNKYKHINTFCKSNNRTFKQSVYDATTRNGFYNLNGTEDTISLEPVLCDIETDASVIIKKMIEQKSLISLTRDEYVKVARFIIVQMSRTYNKLQIMQQLTDSIVDKITAMGANPKDVKQLDGYDDPKELKNIFLSTIVDSLKHVEHILDKSWILHETTADNPYYTSDNPVVKYNLNDTRPLGNLGLKSIGIQIYMPLSSTLILGIVCSSISHSAIKARKSLEYIPKEHLGTVISFEKINNIIDISNAFEYGQVIVSDDSEVEFFNSLQVQHAEEYIFSKTDNFTLVEEILSKHEIFKHGHRFKVGF